MTDRRMKEYIIGKDAVAEFVKTVQEWEVSKDWEKKNRIFNPETGISEDGTMSDCLYIPWINQPKKERKMTREDAIQIVQKLLKTNRLDGTGLSQVWDFLNQPPTLAEFLNKEEGQEYEWRGDILMLENGKIYYKSDKCSSGWCKYAIFGNEIEELRQAKKVEVE